MLSKSLVAIILGLSIGFSPIGRSRVVRLFIMVITAG